MNYENEYNIFKDRISAQIQSSFQANAKIPDFNEKIKAFLNGRPISLLSIIPELSQPLMSVNMQKLQREVNEYNEFVKEFTEQREETIRQLQQVQDKLDNKEGDLNDNNDTNSNTNCPTVTEPQGAASLI